MTDKICEYDNIYDALYDDEQCDSLVTDSSKLLENKHTHVIEENVNVRDISHGSVEQLHKPHVGIDEITQKKTNFIKEAHNEKSISNYEEAALSQNIDKNISTLKQHTDVYCDIYERTESLQTNESNMSNGHNKCVRVCPEQTDYRDVLEEQTNENKTIEGTFDETTHQNEEVNNTQHMPSAKKERFNIYEHGTFNSVNEVVNTKDLGKDRNIVMEGHARTGYTAQDNGVETKTNVFGTTDKSEERTEKTERTERTERTEKNEEKKEKGESRNTFECNICFDDVRDPVVTKCGHLFCWACLSSWIKKNNDCPVCKAEVLRENVIPLYGRGSRSNEHAYKNTTDEPRPTPNRKEPTRRARGGANNVGLRALGVWVNPFSFALSYTNMSEEPYFGDHTSENRRVQTETYQAEIASSFFFFLGCFISLYLFFFPS